MCVSCVGVRQRVQPGHLGVTLQLCFGTAASFIPTGSSVSVRPGEISCVTKGRMVLITDCAVCFHYTLISTPLSPEFSFRKCQSLEENLEIT